MTIRVPHREIADRRELVVAKAMCRDQQTCALVGDVPCLECFALADAAIAAMFVCDEGPKR